MHTTAYYSQEQKFVQLTCERYPLRSMNSSCTNNKQDDRDDWLTIQQHHDLLFCTVKHRSVNAQHDKSKTINSVHFKLLLRFSLPSFLCQLRLSLSLADWSTCEPLFCKLFCSVSLRTHVEKAIVPSLWNSALKQGTATLTFSCATWPTPTTFGWTKS